MRSFADGDAVSSRRAETELPISRTLVGRGSDQNARPYRSGRRDDAVRAFCAARACGVTSADRAFGACASRQLTVDKM